MAWYDLAMTQHLLVGTTLVAGPVIFLIGAGGWRLAYERPLPEALLVIHRDRRRRAWIHGWMIAAMFVSSAGIVAFATTVATGTAVALAVMGASIFALGAVCWISALAFRLTVVPWAAAHTAEQDEPPPGFAALDAWSGALYSVHMASAYAASGVLGAAVIVDGALMAWVGWAGIVWGCVFLVGFMTRFVPNLFNPPFWAHAYLVLVGVMLLRR